MAHFAQINQDSIVMQVLVIEQDQIDTGQFGPRESWIQTSYNTYAGQHNLGGTPLRKNFAGIGYKYDRDRDAFIPPQLYNGWVLNEDTCQWEPPVPQPGPDYYWDNLSTSWVSAT